MQMLLSPDRLQEVTNSLVTSPEFQAMLSRILSGASSNPGAPGAIQMSQNAQSSVVRPRLKIVTNNDGINNGPARSAATPVQFNSSSVGNAQLEMSHLFNRGRGQRRLPSALARPPQRTVSQLGRCFLHPLDPIGRGQETRNHLISLRKGFCWIKLTKKRY